MTLSPVELPPDPERMIEGLRDTGYKFNTALADIIDNSIAANAELVDVTVSMDFRGNIIVSVADDGIGMNRDELINAMQYGSDRRGSAASLGKFGLGLKTASTAFCRRLSVISRASGDEQPIEATWDLTHVARENKWELLLSDTPNPDGLAHLEDMAPEASGTVVVWSNIDRLMKRDYQEPGGPHAQRAIDRLIKDLRDHIGLTYQRFLDTDDKRAGNVVISVNGEAVEAWDPFCIGVSDLVAAQTVPIEIDGGRESEFSVSAYILPRKEEFPDEETEKKAKLSNERQGIYIYRENRLIHNADWLGMYSKEPHGTLLRIEFSFDHKLDEAFRVDIMKSEINLKQELWSWLKDEFLTAPRREANNRYRQGIRRKAVEKAKGSHDTSNTNIKGKEEELDTAKITVIDPKTGEIEVNNRQGQFRLKLPVLTAARPGEMFIQPMDGLNDNALFEPAIIDGKKAVRINTSHPYYHKVYIPNLSSGVTIQGMDSLLWGLCVAELNTGNDRTAEHFKEMRFEVSRLLRGLVEDLPEPDLDADEAA